MGKIRAVNLGDEKEEKKAKAKAEARRQTKASKKGKVEETDVIVDATAPDTEAPKKEIKQKKAKAKVRSKRYQEVMKLVDKDKLYKLADAISLVKQTSLTKFDGTVELHINLNPISLGEKKDYRGSVALPHGTGKEVRVAIADDEVVAQIESGKINFDILVAHPSMMAKLAKVARVLGPRGLMPNPKTGTVSPDPEKRAKELSSGQVNIKTEPSNPIIHMPIGKVSFEDKKIAENITAVLKTLGTKVTKVTLSATMSPGVHVSLN
jgi:large subunit ribosomal protein L1